MTGTAVNWGLGAALAMVASVAARRLASPSASRAPANQRADSALHLVMALGMAAMLVPGGGRVAPAVAVGFAVAGVGLAVRSLRPRRGHRLHHAVMSGIMVLMVHAERMPQSPAPMRMTMPSGAHGASLLLLAAFGYAAGSACVSTWRMSASMSSGEPGGRRGCAIDPLGRGCEITMLVSTAVMLLPVI